jgi:hypothetical protein
MKPHIIIKRFLTTTGDTFYQVYLRNGQESKQIHCSPFKQGSYQVAHRKAKDCDLPLYEVVYTKYTDENGITHLAEEKNIQVKIEKTVVA